jgi:hypothetical protein
MKRIDHEFATRVRVTQEPSGTDSRTEANLAPLTETEKDQLRRYEAVLREGLGTFFQVGSALLAIRENRLYRSTHTTFEAYCRDLWGIGRTYAWRVIGAAERLRLLPHNGPMPINEFQIRPCLKIEPSEFPKAWGEAVARANGGKITATLLASVVRELYRGCRTHPKRKRKNAEKFNTPSLGRILALIQETRHRIEKGDMQQAFAALDDIECALFGESKSIIES